jgi:hypothetical protein
MDILDIPKNRTADEIETDLVLEILDSGESATAKVSPKQYQDLAKHFDIDPADYPEN